VQWDQNLNTVVITTVPVDAKAIFTEASNKSYDWNNYDADVLLKMSMPVKDDAGSVTQMNMDMKMYMTLFMKPSLKAKVNASMVLNMMDQEVTQPIMDMYMTSDDTSLIQYMGMNDGTGKITWMKMTTENDMFADLLKYDAESIKANKELTEKYIKDVKYFGKYPDKSGNVLLKLQYTMSGEIYKDMFGQYMEEMTSSTDEQEAMTAEMLKGLANGNFGDLSCIIYVNEATGEIVKYEMDLSNIIASMMSGMTELLGDIPAEELEMLKQMKASMTMEVLNVNKAKEFEIPKEALNAQEMEEMVKQLEETATETTTETTTPIQ